MPHTKLFYCAADARRPVLFLDAVSEKNRIAELDEIQSLICARPDHGIEERPPRKVKTNRGVIRLPVYMRRAVVSAPQDRRARTISAGNITRAYLDGNKWEQERIEQFSADGYPADAIAKIPATP